MDNYYLKSLAEDNELVCENKYMKDILLPNEDVLYSNKIKKMKKNHQEDSVIVLTDRYVYNLKNKKLKNKADIRNITGITISKKSDQFVVHTYEIDDDFHYSSENRTFILELLARIFFCQTRKKIELSIIDNDHLDDYVTQKSDKKSNKGKTKFDPKFEMDIDHYLYGNLEKNSRVDYEKYITILERHGITNAREKIENMFILDYLIMNEDRHLNNFGIIRDVNTLEWLDIAPIFDNGQSLNILSYDGEELLINGEGRMFFNVQKFDDIIKIIRDIKRIDISKLDGIVEEFDKLLHEYQHITLISDERIYKLCVLLNRQINKLKDMTLK